MVDAFNRPTLISLLLDETKRRYETGNLLAILPIWILALIGGFTCVVLQIPSSFWSDSAKNIPFYTGILTLDGLLLTLAWNAFAKVFENVCTPTFLTYLLENKLVQIYTFHISYVHAAQLLAVSTSSIGLVLLICDNVPLWMNRGFLILTLSSSVYAVKEAIGVVSLLYDLVWYRSIFEANADGRQKVTSISARGK